MVIFVFLGLMVGGAAFAAERPRHFVLELDLAIEHGGLVAAYFDFGDGYWGENLATANVPPGLAPQTVQLLLPTRPIRELRFDPATDASEVVIAGMRLLTDRGELLLRLNPRTLRPLNQIQSIVPEGEGVRVRSEPNANDPMLRLDFPPLQKRMHEALQRPTVGPKTVVLLGVGLATLFLAPLVIVWRALGRADALLGGAGIFFTVFGLRLLWLSRFSHPVPFWDEWEGDVLYMLMPFQGGFLDWGALFMPQWEHRILLTRVIALFGTLLNGEWDPRVAMTLSAAMFSATIALLATVWLGTRRWLGVMAALALAAGAALPYDFNNLLWGGQTQMYALVLMAVVTLGLASVRNITPTIWLGAVMGGLVSLVTMGAGLVGPGCAVGICLVRSWFEPQQRRVLIILAGIFFAVAVLGLSLHVSSRAHEPFYATTWAEFQRTVVGVMAWPLPPRAAWAALLWAPWIVNGVAILRRREASALEWLAVGLGGWALINAGGLGYARHYEGPPFDSRFFTSMSMGAWASLSSSVALAARAPMGWWRIPLPVTISVVTAGLIAVGVQHFSGARAAGAARAELDHRIRGLLATGDRGPLAEMTPHSQASATNVADRLESPLIQPILPAAYRRVLAARNAPEGASLPVIEAGWITLTVRTLMKAGPGIALGGLLTFGYFVWRSRPQASR